MIKTSEMAGETLLKQSRSSSCQISPQSRAVSPWRRFQGLDSGLTAGFFMPQDKQWAFGFLIAAFKGTSL